MIAEARHSPGKESVKARLCGWEQVQSPQRAWQSEAQALRSKKHACRREMEAVGLTVGAAFLRRKMFGDGGGAGGQSKHPA